MIHDLDRLEYLALPRDVRELLAKKSLTPEESHRLIVACVYRRIRVKVTFAAA